MRLINQHTPENLLINVFVKDEGEIEMKFGEKCFLISLRKSQKMFVTHSLATSNSALLQNENNLNILNKVGTST